MKELVQEEVKQACFHCGETIETSIILFDEKKFCCEGCKTVYEILNGSGLCDYYSIENAPGVRLSEEIKNKYAFLDNQDIKKQLLSFTDGKISKISLFIPKIHCSSCIWLLEKLYQLNSSVKSSQINFIKKEVTITFDETILSLKGLVELLASIGYAPDINLASTRQSQSKKINRSLYYKIGVAGFCFGNIMLLSIPEYLDSTVEHTYSRFFSWMNLFLSLPVFLYCSSDYFISAWKAIRNKYINLDIPIAIGIITLFFRSSTEIILNLGPGYMDSLAGLLFFLLIGRWFQNKTYQALSFERDYESYFPVGVTRIVKGKEESILLRNLNVGDRILIRNQELIPSDAILIKGDGNLDYSFVTGESVPVEKKSGDFLYAGGRQVGKTIEVEIQKKVENSYLTQLWNQDVFKKTEDSHLTNLMTRMSKKFTIAVLFISVATAIFWYFSDQSVLINAVTSVLIVACPCALALTAPFSFGNTIRLFGQNGFFLKNADTVEKLSKINTIVFDKTGTITYSTLRKIEFVGDKLTDEELQLIKSLTRNSTHPLSKSIYHSLSADNILSVNDYHEIPAKGIEGWINNKWMKLGSGEFVGLEAEGETLTKVYLGIDGKVKGYFRFESNYRDGFGEMIGELKDKYELHLLSGDHDGEKGFLSGIFPTAKNLHFNQSPMDKLEYIQDLKSKGRNILMVGDGLNDSGALKQSNVGITISDDVYHFSPACDAILNAKKFKLLYKYLNFSKVSIKVIKISFLFSFLYNAVGVSFAVSGMLTPMISAILMPLSSITIVSFVTFSIKSIAKAREL